MLNKILECIDHFQEAENWIDMAINFKPKASVGIRTKCGGISYTYVNPRPSTFSYSKSSIQSLRAALNIRYKEFAINKELIGSKAKFHEFDFIVEPTVFIKVNNLFEEAKSGRIISYTDIHHGL